MGTVHRTDGTVIKVNPDHHPVPHFHIVAADGESVSVAIADMTLLAPKGNRFPRWAGKAMRWARENRTAIQAEWDRIVRLTKG